MATETSNNNNDVAAAMNGSVEALENANYIPQSILVTGGAGTLYFDVTLCVFTTALLLIEFI